MTNSRIASRLRIRDLTESGERWIVSLRSQLEKGVWRGHLFFILDGPAPAMNLRDDLQFEALDLDALVSQAAALDVGELIRRLERSRAGAAQP